MYKSTLKALAAVSDSKQTVDRPGLQNIRINYGDDTITATATDGHVLLRSVEKLDRAETDPDPDTTLLVSGSAAAAAVKLCTGSKDNQDRITIGSGSILTVDGQHKINNDPVDARYPNTDQVWPDPEKVQVQVTLDAALLKRLCDAAISQHGRVGRYGPNASITLKVISDHDAVIFDLNPGDDDTLTTNGLIMPMRR